MMCFRALCAAALVGGATAKFESGNFAQEVEERLWKWVRESGGFVSEAVSAAPRGEMRSIRAVKDIPAGEDIIVIPPKLQLYPDEHRKGSKFFRQMKKLNLPLDASDFGLYILREIRLRATRREADPGAEPAGWDFMWDWLEFHLMAVGDYLQAWDDADIELLGKMQLKETRKSKKDFESSRTRALDFIKEKCPTGEEPACQDFGLGEVTKDEFFSAAHMAWSRAFADGMIVPVASLLNHAPATFNTAIFDYGTYGVSNFRVWANRDIEAGEEITITYGNWHNAMLLAEHAFTFPARLEPNFYFAVDARTLKKEVFEQLDLEDDFPWKVELMTPYLYEDSENDAWDPESMLESVSSLVDLGGLPALEKLVNFYLEGAQQDPLVTPFVEQLAKNRAQNRSSRVWWAEEKDAETSDTSDADAMGSAHKSHIVRVLMSRVLCLMVYREALLLERGEMDASDAIVSADHLSVDLAAIKEEVGSSALEAMEAAVKVVEKAVKKAEFADLPEEELAFARRFISKKRKGQNGKADEL